MKSTETSWEDSARWYDSLHGQEGGGYHKTLLLPGLARILGSLDYPATGSRILDLGCGQGVLCRFLASQGYSLTGLDASPELVRRAAERSTSDDVKYVTGKAERTGLPERSFDCIVSLLALQNMSDLDSVVAECSSLLRGEGHFVFTIIHPCFRIPRQSAWGFDEGKKLMFRRVDSYMTSLDIPIQTHPNRLGKRSPTTITFHRPISAYVQALAKAGFAVLDLQEWCSDRRSAGPKAKAENRAKKEFPLFLTFIARKMS